ncbi:MAG: M14 family zinc carboxypeptidase [Candidatus Hydrothermales bacterium]
MLGFILSLFIYTETLSILQIFIPSEDIIPSLYREGLQEIKRYYREEGILEGVCERRIFEFLEKNKIRYITKISDLEHDFKTKMQNKINFGPYYTYQEAVNELNKIHTTFPNLTSPPISLGLSWEGRNIYAMKISDNPSQNENEPVVLLTGVHHAREPISCSIVLEFAKYLLTRYGTDPDATWLLNNRELWIVPVVNPDGYVYNESSSSGMWRKNRRNNGDGSFGVDLNRNYGYMWGYDNYGSSGTPSSEIYRGPSPFSEPETQAIRALCNQVKPVIALNYHSYSNLLLYPWDYADIYTPDNNLYRAMSEEMTIKNGYEYGTGWELLYNANGTSDDWMYGEQNEKPKILAFTPEVGEAFWQPDTNIIKDQIDENLPMNMFALKAAGHYVIIDSIYFVDQNGSTHIDPGDTLSLTLWLKNLGVNGNLTDVKLILKSGGLCAYVIDTLIDFPDIPAFPGNSVCNTLPLRAIIHSSFPDTSAIPFLLKIQGNPFYSRTESFFIENRRSQVIFEDGFETGLSNWVEEGSSTPWERTNSTRRSGYYSLTDSPNSNYSNYQDTWIRTKNAIYLSSNLDSFKLVFWTKYNTENSYDFVYVEVSTNNLTWHKLASFTGIRNSWRKETFDLTPYKGQSVYIRFRLQTDQSVVKDGIYIDDVKVFGYKKPYFAVCEVTKISERGSDVLRESVYPGIKNLNSFLLKSKIDNVYKIEFYDASGKKIKKERVFLKEGEEYYFKPKVKGLYFYIIETKHFRKTGKFIVN